MCFGKKKSHHPGKKKKKRVSVQTAESLMSRMLMLQLNYYHVWLSLYFTQFQALFPFSPYIPSIFNYYL